MNKLQMLDMYLTFPFVRYAIIVGVLIALCSSVLGVTLVLKRFSLIGDGLSHVAFGAMAVAGVLQPVLKEAGKSLAASSGSWNPAEVSVWKSGVSIVWDSAHVSPLSSENSTNTVPGRSPPPIRHG